jgi:3-deoxy-D-manno-octulosonic-acid transferase
LIRAFYNILVVPLVWAGFRGLALFDEKARLAFSRRRSLLRDLEKKIKDFPGEKKRILLHVSSVGEYLQARPLILALKERYPGAGVILSFVSSSLEDQLAGNPAADLETYLPLDTRGSVRRFLDLVRPDLIIFSTYDVWPNLLWQASDREIPAVLVNATLSVNSGRLQPGVRRFFSSLYSRLDCIGAISEKDAERFRLLGIPGERIEITGNCRFEQTLDRAGNVREDDPVLASLPGNKVVLVAGSTWPEDEAVILPAFFKLAGEFSDLGLIIAPHEPKEQSIAALEKSFAAQGFETERLSRLPEARGGQGPARVILVDCVGQLFKLYRVGAMAFVGGSFGRAVHNVMEPAAFGLPVLFGPRHENSQEALLMKERGGAFSVADRAELEAQLHVLIQDKVARTEAGERARALLEENRGATMRTVQFLKERFPGILA